MASLSLSPDQRYFKQDHAYALEFYGEDITVTANDVPGSKHLIIRGDRVQLGADIKLSGRNVAIYCRTLVCDAPRTIDVSGGSAPPKQARAASGTVSGAPGVHGNPGGSGLSAGQIVIIADSLEGKLVLRADGGAGQDGQDGGNGAPGKKGANGADGEAFDFQPEGKSYQDGEHGHNGSPGGAAGNGGQGGLGGKAGVVSTRLLRRPGAKQITVEAAPGLGGRGGLAGNCGPGGAGGAGGRLLSISSKAYDEGNKFHDPGFYSWGKLSTKHAASGIAGPPGRAGKQGAAGKPGSSPYGAQNKLDYTPCVTTSTLQVMKANLALPQLRLMMNAAERHYLCGAFDIARERLGWLVQVLHAPGNLGSERLSSDPEPVVAGVDLNDAKTVTARAVMLLGQLMRGLCIDGLPRDFVPLQSLAVWSDLFERSVSVLAATEATAGSFSAALSNLKATKGTLKAANDATSAQIKAMTERLNPLRVQLDQADVTIAKLLVARDACTQELEQAHDDFKSAVLRYNRANGGSCDFKKTVQIVGTLVAVASGVGTAYASFQTALMLTASGPGSGPITSLEQIKGLATYVRTVYGQVDGGIDALQGALNKLDSIAARDPLLVVRQADLDAMLTEYRQLPEASRYRALIDDLVLKSQALNETCLARDAIAAHINEILSAAQALNEEKARIKDQLSATSGSVDIKAAQFVAALMEQLRRDCLWVLMMEARTLNFKTLSSLYPDLSYTNALALRGAQARMEIKLAEANDQYSAVMQDFETHSPLTISQLTEDGARLLSVLRERRLMTFQVALSDPMFAGYCHVTVDEVMISFDRFTVAGSGLHVKVTHMGDGRSVNSSGQVYLHRYHPRSTTILLSADGDTILTPGILVEPRERPSQLAPFGTWSLEISSEPGLNLGLDLSALTQVTIRFKAHGRSRAG